MKNDRYHMLALTRRDLNKTEILHQWNVAISYVITSWFSDTLKIKASNNFPGEKVMKVYIYFLISLLIFLLIFLIQQFA
jgi:hypothetical protein